MRCARPSQMRPYGIAVLLLLTQIVLQVTCSECRAARPEDLETVVAEDLELRETIRAVKPIEKKTRSLQQARSNCSSRLRAGLLPGGCFKTLHLEHQLRILDNVGVEREAIWLNRLCATRARSSTSWANLEETLEMDENLGSQCRMAIQARLAELRYQEEEKDPAQLFSRRHSAKAPIAPDIAASDRHDP